MLPWEISQTRILPLLNNIPQDLRCPCNKESGNPSIHLAVRVGPIYANPCIIVPITDMAMRRLERPWSGGLSQARSPYLTLVPTIPTASQRGVDFAGRLWDHGIITHIFSILTGLDSVT